METKVFTHTIAKGHNIDLSKMDKELKAIEAVDMATISNGKLDALLTPFKQEKFAVGIITDCVQSNDKTGDDAVYRVKVAFPHASNQKDHQGNGRMTVQTYHVTSYTKLERGSLYSLRIASFSVHHVWYTKDDVSRHIKKLIANESVVKIVEGKQRLHPDFVLACRAFKDDAIFNERSQTDFQGTKVLNVTDAPDLINIQED